MRSTKVLWICGAILLVALAPVLIAAQSQVSYSTVTDARLLNPEPGNWLMYRGNYSGWGYSPLDQVGPQNVKKLAPVWAFSTGVTEGHQSPPIVNNGVMFITTPQQQVIALNAKNGNVLWSFQAGAGVNAPPSSYTVGGKQYIVVAAGGNVQLDYKRGNNILAFTID